MDFPSGKTHTLFLDICFLLELSSIWIMPFTISSVFVSMAF